MHRYLTTVLAIAVSAAAAHAQDRLDFNAPVIPEAAQMQDFRVVSGHAFSLSVLGLEYSYEQRLGGNWSLIGRAGLTCSLIGKTVRDEYNMQTIDNGNTVTTTTNHQHIVNYYWGPRPGITVEPRYYTNLERRYLKGKKTVNNSADYVSLQIKAFYGAGFAPVRVSLIPTYGIRRGGNHWFREYTFGVGFHSAGAILPHLGFRIGYKI